MASCIATRFLGVSQLLGAILIIRSLVVLPALSATQFVSVCQGQTRFVVFLSPLKVPSQTCFLNEFHCPSLRSLFLDTGLLLHIPRSSSIAGA